MELTILAAEPRFIRAGYTCPCGCRPSLTYAEGDETVRDGCCCGNEFALGPYGSEPLEAREGFTLERSEVITPWRERLEAAWLVGPSTHSAPVDTGMASRSRTQDATLPEAPSVAMDPVCGMTVDPADARARGLHSRYRDTDYYFCAKGCKLDFDEDPEHYLDTSYVPSM
jgi:YHS domain-containing protein